MIPIQQPARKQGSHTYIFKGSNSVNNLNLQSLWRRAQVSQHFDFGLVRPQTENSVAFASLFDLENFKVINGCYFNLLKFW